MKKKLMMIGITGILLCAGCVCSDPLSLWNEGATKTHIKECVKAARHCGVQEMVAVFDFDGTLFNERDKTYFDWYIAALYVLENAPSYTKEELEVAKRVVDNGVIPSWEEPYHDLSTTVFKGMSVGDYAKLCRRYADLKMPSFDNLRRKDAFFLPMLQLIEYMQDSGIEVYICTGTDRTMVRALCDGKINIPPSHIIGSTYDKNIKKSKAGNYDWDVTIGDNLLFKNLHERKIVSIMDEIGIRPLIVVGNSSGDYEMASLVWRSLYDQDAMGQWNVKYSSVIMVCCDDTERDTGNVEEAAKVRSECDKKGWIPVSVKNDWKTVYGEEVRKNR